MQEDRLAGTQLGSYRIQEKLGEGGMALVYRAYHELMKREVAIKVILPHHANNPGFKERFTQEAQAIARLQHRNIVTVYDFGEINAIMFLAMQYVRGASLRNRLVKGQPLQPRLAALYALQMARALQHAHEHSVIHRDVKPANMLLTTSQSNELLLSDFGIARLFDQSRGNAAASPAGSITGSPYELSHLAPVVGTPFYMAPEQYLEASIDGRADIYALGVVLYEMLTGQVPFRANNFQGMLYQHTMTPPRPPHMLNTTVPQELERITLHALEKMPQNRFQAAEEMAQELKAFLVPSAFSAQMPTAQIPVELPPPRKPLWRARNIAILLMIILIIIQILLRLGILHFSGSSLP
jgi:serine/threonine protein kinase